MPDAGFDAHGCGAATAAGSAAVTLVRGATVLDAARIGAREIADELGGLSPAKLHAAELAADALARALGAAVRARAALTPPSAGGRTLVAMSGGVDSAVAALRCAREGETAAVTLELWSDRRERRRAQLLLGLRRRTGARARALDGPPALHDRPARRVPRRRRRAVHRRLRRRRDAEPVRRLQRARAPRRDARAGRPARLRRARHRPLRADRRAGARRRAAAARRRRPGQGPDLHARRARAELAGADAVPARRADQARGAGARGAGRAAGRDARSTRRTCASSPAPTGPASSRATAASATGSGRSSTSGPACSAATTASTASRSGSGAGSASRGGEPLYVLDKDADTNRVIVGPREALASARVRCAALACTARARASTASSSATARGRSPRRVLEQPEGGRHRR